MLKRLPGFLLIFALLLLDQITKILALTYLKNNPPIPIIENIFELHYIENTGSAFGMFSGSVQIFAVITLVMSVLLLAVYSKMPLTKEYKVYRVLFVFLVAGAFGNVIDRIFRGYVVDFLYFKLINFPVFNVADCYLTISIFILAMYYLIHKDDRLERLFKKKQPDNT